MATISLKKYMPYEKFKAYDFRRKQNPSPVYTPITHEQFSTTVDEIAEQLLGSSLISERFMSHDAQDYYCLKQYPHALLKNDYRLLVAARHSHFTRRGSTFLIGLVGSKNCVIMFHGGLMKVRRVHGYHERLGNTMQRYIQQSLADLEHRVLLIEQYKSVIYKYPDALDVLTDMMELKLFGYHRKQKKYHSIFPLGADVSLYSILMQCMESYQQPIDNTNYLFTKGTGAVTYCDKLLI